MVFYLKLVNELWLGLWSIDLNEIMMNNTRNLKIYLVSQNEKKK